MTLQGLLVARAQLEIGHSGEADLRVQIPRGPHLQSLGKGSPGPGDASLQCLPVEADRSEETGLRIMRMESANLLG
jgi:hypothetical protein